MLGEETLPSESELTRSRHGRERVELFRVRTRDIVVVLALGLLQAACLVAYVVLIWRIVGILVPRTVGRAADAELVSGLWMSAGLAVIAVASGFLRSREFRVAERAGYLIVRNLRMEMYAHLQRMLPGHLRHRARGGLLLRLTGDLSMLRMWISRGFLIGMSALIVLITGIGVLFWLDPVMACAVIAILSGGSVVSLTNGARMREATRSMRRRRSLLIGNIDEQINSLQVIQSAGRTAGEYARLARQNDSLTRALIRVAALRGRLRGVAVSTSLLTTAVIVAIGLLQARSGHGDVPKIVVAIAVARQLTRPVRALGLAHDYWHRGLVSRQKVVDFLRSRSRHPSEEDLDRLRVRHGRIEFHDVSVDGILADFTATAEAGTIVGITGGGGSGASTVLDLVARIAEPTSGKIVIDEQDLSGTRPSSVGRAVGYAAPGLPLLRGSVLRNLTYAQRRPDPAEIQRIVFGLGLDETLDRVGDEGVRAWLTEGGANADASDRALIALGRALMGNPPIVLLDEPFFTLDEEARTRAMDVVRRHRGTVLLASADPRDLELADVIWVLHEGVLTEVVDADEYRTRTWLAERGVHR